MSVKVFRMMNVRKGILHDPLDQRFCSAWPLLTKVFCLSVMAGALVFYIHLVYLFCNERARVIHNWCRWPTWSVPALHDCYFQTHSAWLAFASNLEKEHSYINSFRHLMMMSISWAKRNKRKKKIRLIDLHPCLLFVLSLHFPFFSLHLTQRIFYRCDFR